MFRIPLLIVVMALCLVGGILGVGIFHLGSSDHEQYQKLVESSTTSAFKKDSLISFSQQARQNVCKDVWFREEMPLHCRIHSKESELFFFPEGKTMELVEEMRHVKCVMQEELFYCLPDGREVIMKEKNRFLIRNANPSNADSWIDSATVGLVPMQEVRYFEAEEACYNYTTQLFFAQKVKLWKYRMPGHEPPQSFAKATTVMSGTAQNVEFVLKSGHEFDFRAHLLKATFDAKKGAV